MENIIKKIEKYDKIIIHRHTRPDLDALGSQIGLAEAIKITYPNKKVFVVGDESSTYSFIGKMDDIADIEYSGSLAIITDVAVSKLVSDCRYKLAAEVIIIDHHMNETDIKATTLIDSNYSSAAELVTDFIRNNNLRLSKYGATALYGGMVTDTGRFQYAGVNARTFKNAAYLLENGADIFYIYNNLYVETLESKKMKSFFSNRFCVTDDNVAYLKNDLNVIKKFNVDVFTISRGMVNLMAGIEKINVWANFTYDEENKQILCEIRSRGVETLQVAKKYGGGGHPQACGCQVKTWDDVDNVIRDLNIIARSVRND